MARRSRPKSKPPQTLRERAEEKWLGQHKNLTPDQENIAALLHDLEVHQIELELQNEELRRVQVELEESRNQFTDLYDYAPVGYLTLRPDIIIMRANLRAATLLGTERGNLIGKLFTLFVGRESQDTFYRYWNALNPGSPPHSCELLLRKVDGTLIPVSMETENQGVGSATEWRCAIMDITARRRAEEALRESQERTRKKEKLESLGVMAGGLAHDFNNLLTGVIGNASLMADELPPDSLLRRRTEDIVRAGQHAASLTRQLLAYAGKGQFYVTVLDVIALVNGAVALLNDSIPASVSLSVEIPEGLPPVCGDSAQLQQLLMSLLSNAVEAIGARSGTIWIKAGVVDTHEAIAGLVSATVVPPGKYVHIEVKDTGSGMDMGTMAKIYDPFFTTKFAGRGLGLAAARGIVEAHSGAIRVTSEPGRGTAFDIYLPAASAPATISARAESVATEDLSGSGTVLVVDDEETVRQTALAALQHYGYSVLLAEDGPSAIEVVRKSGNVIRAIVLDLSMPDMSGAEALPHLKKLQPALPVLLTSGYDQAMASEQFAGTDIAGFIQKPYTAADLARHIKLVLGSSVG